MRCRARRAAYPRSAILGYGARESDRLFALRGSLEVRAPVSVLSPVRRSTDVPPATAPLAGPALCPQSAALVRTVSCCLLCSVACLAACRRVCGDLFLACGGSVLWHVPVPVLPDFGKKLVAELSGPLLPKLVWATQRRLRLPTPMTKAVVRVHQSPRSRVW